MPLPIRPLEHPCSQHPRAEVGSPAGAGYDYVLYFSGHRLPEDGAPIQLSSAGFHNETPDVSSGWVAWAEADRDAGTSQVVAWDIDAGTRLNVPMDVSEGYSPVVYADRLVYT